MTPLRLERDAKTGLWLRPGTTDRPVVRALAREYGALAPYLKGATVLDVGAHVGGFARMALNAGVAAVVAVEPDAENAAIFRKNVPEVELIEAAVTYDGRSVALHCTSDPSAYSIYSTRLRPEVRTCRSVAWKDVLTSEIDVVKMDAEGAEYELLQLGVPDRVEALAVEWHFRNRTWLAAARGCHALIADQGMRVVDQHGIFDEGRRNCVVVYARRSRDRKRRPGRTAALQGRRMPPVRERRALQ